MRRAAACLALAACTAAPPTPPVPVTPSVVAAPPPNFVVTDVEVVGLPEDDGVSTTRIFVGGALTGRTGPGLRSREKRWEGRLEPGNHPVRFERWILPRVWDWVREGGEPERERFVRVEPGQRTVVAIRYGDGGRRCDVRVIRGPLEAPARP